MVRVARKLGLHSSFFSEITRRKTLDVGLLVAALRELDVTPPAFFAELEGEAGDRVGLWGPIRDRATPEARRAVRFAYRRMRTELAGVDLIAELEDEDGDAKPPAAAGPSLGAAWLEDLDGRRQDEPETVAAEVAACLHRIEPALLPRALGVWCSALRLLLELDVAAYLNRWAVRLAEAAGDSASAADLYIRRSYIVADGGDHSRALLLTQLAAGMFASLGEDADEGRALVDCGRWLHYQSRNRESASAFERALALLPESQHANRLGSFLMLGVVFLALDQPDDAERCAELSEPLATSRRWCGKVSWLRARILRKRGLLNECEAQFRSVVDSFRGIHYGEAALAACELVQVILEQRKPAEARQVCASLLPMLEPLRKNRIVDAAVSKLVLEGTHGVLTIELVRETMAAIDGQARDTRARLQWRALTAAG